MSHGSSESQLKALESSKGDPESLLNQAISIAGLNNDELIDHDRSRFAPRTSQTFKEQWLLRWVIKRLGEAVQDNPDNKPLTAPQTFATNGKTWVFLTYLLTVIPSQKSIEILLERNFTKLLFKSSSILIEHQGAQSSHEPLATRTSKDSKRLHKRRRLSPSSEDTATQVEASLKNSNGSALLNFLKVIELWGDILQPSDNPHRGLSRTVPPAWSNSVNDAAEFVGSALATAEEFFRTSLDQQTDPSNLRLIVPWLRLWHAFAASNNTTERNEAYKCFNQACLSRCLSLRDLLVTRDTPWFKDSLKEVERQIALYTISPLRSVILSKSTAIWRADGGTISWEDIEPIHLLVEEQLGDTLRSQGARGDHVQSLSKSSWSCYLVSIASRLVPKADIRNRLRELSWIQALIMSLIYLSFPNEMPKLLKNPDGLLQPIDDALSLDTNAVMQWPENMLLIIQEEEIALSMPVKEYMFAGICAWRNRPLSMTVISALVKIDPGIFLPDQSRPDSRLRLSDLLRIINEQDSLSQGEYDQAIIDIIQPIMESAIRAREFEGWVSIWLPLLSEALRVRAITEFSTEGIPIALIWDVADLFIYFTNLYRIHQSPAFDRALSSGVLEDMKTIRERIGPTSDIFAKLAILTSLLEARGTSVLQHAEVGGYLEMLADLAAAALEDHNDYQGQRWRLWSLLAILRRLDARFDRYKLLVQVLETACNRFWKMSTGAVHKLRQSQRSALLMEQREIFVFLLQCLIRTREFEKSQQQSIDTLIAGQAQNLVKLLNELQNPPKDDLNLNTGSGSSALWDGRINNLRNIKQFVDGHVAILLSYLSRLESDSPNTSALLTPISLAISNGRGHAGDVSVTKTFVRCATSFLLQSDTRHDFSLSNHNLREKSKDHRLSPADSPTLEHTRLTRTLVESLAKSAVEDTASQKKAYLQSLYAVSEYDMTNLNIKAIIEAAAVISNADEPQLRESVSFAKSVASSVLLNVSDLVLKPQQLVLLLEYTIFVLRSQPKTINQATIDTLLKNMAIITSAALKIDSSNSTEVTKVDADTMHMEVAIFDRMVSLVGVLLTRYRRRLTGRTHLLLPVLQNLLKCFFYTPNRSYLYQNAAISRQKTEFRASLPLWLSTMTLPLSSATKFTKVVTSICNPSTASARSAHRTRSTKGSILLELNDETQKARKIAARYMQYLIMEFARCSLDGVISPDVRESLMPGFYTIIDAMDRDLMKTMNAAMDPSSREIFKGVYDDWVKHWKWDQS